MRHVQSSPHPSIAARLQLICRSQMARLLSRVGVVVLLSTLVPRPAKCQTPVPEFYGFYAVDGSRMVALYEGRDPGGTATISQGIYSIPNNGAQTWTVAVLPTTARFIIFYASAGDMIKAMTFHRLPLLRNVVETPDLNEVQLAAATGHVVSPRVISTPNIPLLARIPELESRILTKPVPNQLQMVELVPNAALVPGLYVFDYSPAPNQGWNVVVSIGSTSEQEKPYCLDLILPGGYGGVFWRANSELNDAVPALDSGRYKKCDASASSSTSGSARSAPFGGSANVAAASCSDYDPCLQAAFAAYKSQDWNNATANFEAAAVKRPTSGEPWLWLGRILLSDGVSVQLQDLANDWDKALALGTTIKIGACHERGFQACERGDLLLSTKSVSFLANGTAAVFAAPPNEITPGNVLDNSPGAHISYGLRVGGKNYKFDFIPPGIVCDFSIVVHCPPEGVATQLVMAQYVSQTLPKLASGALSTAPNSAIVPTSAAPAGGHCE
jgi:hypothetical protein